MKWWPAQCQPGDMVRVRIGSIWHYGIYISDGEVIQFGPPPRQPAPREAGDIRVCATTMDEFAGGSIVEAAQLTPAERRGRVPPRQTIARARARLGEGGYDLLHNNCEHFAYECAMGVKHSEQEAAARRQWAARPLAEILLMPLPDDLPDAPLCPESRNAEVRRARDERLRRQRYWAWRALAFAVKDTFDYDMAALDFKKKRSGKWVCGKLEFSITHGGGWVAAAVSNRPVGIDLEVVETFAREKPWREIGRRIATPAEAAALPPDEPEAVLALWTRKESAFKRAGGAVFRPARIDALDKSLRTLVTAEGVMLSVCSEHCAHARLRLFDGETARACPAREWTVDG